MEPNLNPSPAPAFVPQAATTTDPTKRADGTNLDGTVTITLNCTAMGGEVGFLVKGEKANVSVAYADCMQDAWHLASRSDVPNFQDPSRLPEAQGVSVAKANFEAKQKRIGK